MINEIMKYISEYDPEVGKAVEAECTRQRRNLELIASETQNDSCRSFRLFQRDSV